VTERTAKIPLAQRVSSTAYELLAEGRNPTVRAIRERVRGSTNEVAAALAQWRKGLQHQIEARIIDYGIPRHVVEYVRLGILAAEQMRASNEGADATTTVGLLERANAALDTQARLLEQERAVLTQTIGRLEEELSSARTVAVRAERLQQALDAARVENGTLKAELARAREKCIEVDILEQRLFEAQQEATSTRDTLVALQIAHVKLRAKRLRRAPAAASGKTSERAGESGINSRRHAAQSSKSQPRKTARTAEKPRQQQSKSKSARSPRRALLPKSRR
jgi:hypothetical protein